MSDNVSTDVALSSMVVGPDECQTLLDSVNNVTSRHRFHRFLIASVMKRRDPVTLYLHKLVTKWAGLTKPSYFYGCTERGVRFLGDYFDLDCAYWETRKDHSKSVIDVVTKCINEYSAQDIRESELTFIDVGCNGGVLSATVMHELSQRLNNRVTVDLVAVEANPETSLRAACTFALNKMSSVKLVRAAAGEDFATVEFQCADGLSGQASIHSIDAKLVRSVNGYPVTTISVPQIPLDCLLSQGYVDRKVACVKIDVEGHELSVIRGAQELLSVHRPFVLCEFNPRTAKAAGWTAMDLREELEKAMGPCDLTVMNYDAPPTEFPPSADSRDIVDILVKPKPLSA